MASERLRDVAPLTAIAQVGRVGKFRPCESGNLVSCLFYRNDCVRVKYGLVGNKTTR